MSKLFDRLDAKKKQDIKVLANFISIFCRENHLTENKDAYISRDERLHQILAKKELILCRQCQRLLSHGIAKLMICPYDPKPACKKCPAYCFAPGYRKCIREVMRFSGKYLIRHGRLDLIFQYFW